MSTIKEVRYDEVFKNRNNYSYIDTIDFKEYLGSLSFKSIFEVGCGNGRNLNYFKSFFPDMVVGGCELSHIGVDFCLSNGLDVVKCSADRIPIYDRMFDVVLTVHALEQMKYIIDDVVKEIFRLSNRYVVCFEPVFCLQNVFGKFHNFMNDYVRGIPFLLEKHGFNVVRLERLGFGRFNNRTCLVVGEKIL